MFPSLEAKRIGSAEPGPERPAAKQHERETRVHVWSGPIRFVSGIVVLIEREEGVLEVPLV